MGGGGPDGISGFRQYNIVSNANHGALLARINRSQGWLLIGKGGTFNSSYDGTLEFAVNDREPSNNSGGFTVNVTVCKAR